MITGVMSRLTRSQSGEDWLLLRLARMPESGGKDTHRNAWDRDVITAVRGGLHQLRVVEQQVSISKCHNVI